MKIKANDYNASEIIKIIREWTELTQKQFGETIHRSRHTVQSMELGRSGIYLDTLLEIADKHGLEITIEKTRG
jgi:DNA-binding transcriptional regulator YiaG